MPGTSSGRLSSALEFEGKRVIFSGDLGRYGRPLLYDPEPIGDADDIVCESTYADRVHPPDPLDDLRKALVAGIARGGAIVIPAFAVERTQDILLAIATLQAARSARSRALPRPSRQSDGRESGRVFEKFPDAHKPIPRDSAANAVRRPQLSPCT